MYIYICLYIYIRRCIYIYIYTRLEDCSIFVGFIGGSNCMISYIYIYVYIWLHDEFDGD